MNTTEYAYLYVHPEAVFACVYTNSEADSFEIVQAVQCLLGLGQVLGKLGMQQPHGQRHHGAWTGGREGGKRTEDKKKTGDRGKMCEGRGKIRNRVGYSRREREKKGREGRERQKDRVQDENINPSTHTQTAHSPGGRNLQMALSYVWLLIKPSHLSLYVCCTAPSLIFLPHPSVSLSASTSFTQSHTHRGTHIPEEEPIFR